MHFLKKEQGCASLHTPVRLSRRHAALSGVNSGQFVQKLLSLALGHRSLPLQLTAPFCISERFRRGFGPFQRRRCGGHDVLDLAIRSRNALARIHGPRGSEQNHKPDNGDDLLTHQIEAGIGNKPREQMLYLASRDCHDKGCANLRSLWCCFRFGSLFLPSQAPIAEHGPSYIIRDVKTGLNIPNSAGLGIGQRGLLSTFPH
jgi:hypothetical protein